MKIFTVFCFTLFTLVACGKPTKPTDAPVVADTPMTADATPVATDPVVDPLVPEAVLPMDAEMSMDATPVVVPAPTK